MSWIREQKLLRLVEVLWGHLTPDQQLELEPAIRREGVAWALPLAEQWDNDDWLTEDELAQTLGLTVSAVRNWPRRHKEIVLVDGKFRWGDVKMVQLKFAYRNAA